ncbi:substrate-binding domain-containing protein [Streptomyces sp. NPDC002540]
MADVTSAVVRQRLTGYRDAWTEGGLSPEDLGVVECGTNDPAAARRAVRGLLSRHGPRPTAVLAVSDSLALGACHAAHEHGLSVPHDLSVLGYDDSPAAATASVPLTTVHQPTDGKGETAARLLLERIGQRSATPAAAALELPTRLVVRSSTAAAPETKVSDRRR